MNHCKTCRHFKAVYPLNKQLGNCEFRMVSSTKPCGHTISGNYIDTKVFTSTGAKGLPECANRVMEDFGCVYHAPNPNPEWSFTKANITVWLLRERMISPEWVLQFLDKTKFDMPEAKDRIFK